MFVNSKKCNLKRITHTIESELKQNLMCVGERKGISVHFLVKFNKIRSKHKLKLLHLYLIESTIFVKLFKDHPWEQQNVIFVYKWSLVTDLVKITEIV